MSKTNQEISLIANLAVEIAKDLNYTEIYNLAHKALIDKLSQETVKALSDEYGERYDYVFLDRGIDPFFL